MGIALTMQPWLEQSRQFFMPLSNAETLTVDTETISGTLKSLQQWMVTNPCPDMMLGDRVNMIVARYGYLALVGAADRTALDEDQQAALNERLRKLVDDLVALIAEVEQFRTGHSADGDEN
jgi:hypothetical protein